MEDFLLEHGIWILAPILFVDDLGWPFFPAATLLFSAVVLARTTGEVSILHLFLIAATLAPMANAILFFLGKKQARGWILVHGHRFFLTKKRVEKAEKIFEKYGEKTVFLGSMMTTIRPACSFIAGGLGMKTSKFFAYHFAGLLVYLFLVFTTGYFLGPSIFGGFENFFSFLLAALIFLGVLRILVWGVSVFLSKK